ncbi:MAG: hypothetical protein RLY65_1907 [Pseudomonadota bacterium]
MSQCLLWWIAREAQTWGCSHHIRAIAGTWAVRLTGVAALWLLYGCQVWLIRPIMSIDAGRTDRDKPCISPERLALQTEQVGLA